MVNLEYLKSKKGKPFDGTKGAEARKVIALEIIAEELCIMNENFDKVTTGKPYNNNNRFLKIAN